MASNNDSKMQLLFSLLQEGVRDHQLKMIKDLGGERAMTLVKITFAILTKFQ